MKFTLLSFLFVVVFGFTATAQSAKSAPLKVFPNPTTEFFSVNDMGENTGYVSVFSLMGRNLREFEFVKEERYYIGDLPKGIYLIYMQDKNKKTISTHKIEKR
jgi:hypothetical protein